MMTKKILDLSAILLAAGAGTRLAASQPKAFVQLAGQPLFIHSLKKLSGYASVGKIVLVVPREQISLAKKLITNFAKVGAIVAGGATRAESLLAGLKKITSEFVLVQNAANPHITVEEITACLTAAKNSGAAAVGRAATATIKRVHAGRVVATLPREEIWLTETPQIVRRDLLVTGLRLARMQKIQPTDELQLAELAGCSPRVVFASAANQKVTTREDLVSAESRSGGGEKIRVGIGQDSHRFSSIKKPLVLAGVRLTAGGGLAGNSDADVILHAACNAISSALGGGSLSMWSDRLCRRGVTDSREYLAVILTKMQTENFRIGNVSVALEAAQPRLEIWLPRLQKNLAKLFHLKQNCIGLTVTSGESLTAVGRGEGIAATVIVLLQK